MWKKDYRRPPSLNNLQKPGFLCNIVIQTTQIHVSDMLLLFMATLLKYL